MNRHQGFLLTSLLFVGTARAEELPKVSGAEIQPLVAQVTRLTEALSFLGSGLLSGDVERITNLRDSAPRDNVADSLQNILDPYCLAMVHINPEARVRVLRGPAKAELVRNGWRSFLIKVHNEAGITPELAVESPNALPLLHRSTGANRVQPQNVLSPGEVSNRFLELALYGRRPLLRNLSGVKLEYVVLQLLQPRRGKAGGENKL